MWKSGLVDDGREGSNCCMVGCCWMLVLLSLLSPLSLLEQLDTVYSLYDTIKQ